MSKKNIGLNNRWVVPYKKYLLLRYNSHTNVEVCDSIFSVKYIYKCVYKGLDCAGAEVFNSCDEILSYVTGRYVSATEGISKIFPYKIHN